MEQRRNDASFKHVKNKRRGAGRITCALPISQNLVKNALIESLCQSAGEMGERLLNSLYRERRLSIRTIVGIPTQKKSFHVCIAISYVIRLFFDI